MDAAGSSFCPVHLTSHKDYLDLLNKLRMPTHRIVIVQTDGRSANDPVLSAAMETMDLESESAVSQWAGTRTRGSSAIQYTFIKRREFFGRLAEFESFFIELPGDSRFSFRVTDFGIDDIALYNIEGELLFYTVTHEGIACINSKLLS